MTTCDQPNICVTFVNSTDQTVLGATDLPLNELPETFEIQTTLHLGNDEWSIVEAIPTSAREFIHTKKLTLKLSKIKNINPQKLLFTLPTIANELPLMDCTNPFNDFVYEMHEDCWRQAEFLLNTDIPDIEQEIHAIANIWEHSREEVNDSCYVFNKIHVRSKVDHPQLQIEFKILQNILGTQKVGALAIPRQEDTYVEDGFAIQTPAGVFYGIVYAQNVSILGLTSDEAVCEETRTKLIEKITSEFNLVFVDWCSCATLPA